jgi:hypothetical protein
MHSSLCLGLKATYEATNGLKPLISSLYERAVSLDEPPELHHLILRLTYWTATKVGTICVHVISNTRESFTPGTNTPTLTVVAVR